MLISFPPDVMDRLHRIEREGGMPVVEFVHQAVAVWSYLETAERRILGLAAIRLVLNRRGDDR